MGSFLEASCHYAQLRIYFCLGLVLVTAGWTCADTSGKSSTVYIVRLKGVKPIASYNGHLPNYPSTLAVGQPKKIDTRSPHVQAYGTHIRQMQLNALHDAGIGAGSMLSSYKYVHNGFTARLSEAEATRLRSLPQVARVIADTLIPKATTFTPQFLNLPSTLWKAAGGAGAAGENVIIGVVDTGVWPENPAFSDRYPHTYSKPPAHWKGHCNTTRDFPSCNNKLIGANFFYKNFDELSGVVTNHDNLSPRDNAGHGTHTSSTAGGNANNPVVVLGSNYGFASGMAPRARLAVYKVFWESSDKQANGTSAAGDIIAAIDAAVADGVDVLSLSLGGPALNQFFDPLDLTYLEAMKAGVIISAASGNSGPAAQTSSDFFSSFNPPPSSLSNADPWLISVGASSHSRAYSTTLTLGNKKAYTGGSLIGSPKPSQHPLVDSTRAGLPGQSAISVAQCQSRSLDPSKVRGTIVICQRGGNGRIEKSLTALQAGAVAMVLVNTNNASLVDVNSDLHYLPAVHVAVEAGSAIRAYALTANRPTAVLSSVSTTYSTTAPYIAGFSSQGPVDPSLSSVANDVMKPDIIGPGVNIWAAWSLGILEDSRRLPYNIISGTSMATPHIAGIAAVLRSLYPHWSPMAIKSAIMTSAVTTNNRGRPIQLEKGQNANPFALGSGQVNPAAAINPGLIYDATYGDMLNFLFSYDLTSALELGLDGTNVKQIETYNLNTPNIAVSLLLVQTALVVTRTVTCVSNKASTYKVRVSAPLGVSVQVTPSSFNISPNQKVTYTVTFMASLAAGNNEFHFGYLTWSDGTHVVKSVLAVQPVLGLGR